MLRNLPSVNELLAYPLVTELAETHGRLLVLSWIRSAVDAFRQQLQTSNDPLANTDREQLVDDIVESIMATASRVESLHLRKLINATGVVLHTSLGRAPLSVAARHALQEAAGACNLEVDLESGERRYRGYQLEPTWQLLTGCERAALVNNNAAATLLTLQALCAGREVVISRGELIEIGGSFRLPEIFQLSGAILREVGTTNRTRISDYERAIGPNTAAIMRVHPSNYRVVGFVERPALRELIELAQARGVHLIDDIGSGALFDTAQAGFSDEPTFQQSVAAGSDIVMGSGDKLLGGPQCGIVLGKAPLIEVIQQHPLARAVRIDKLALAALSATLDSYVRDAALEEIPTLRMLHGSPDELRCRAEALVAELVGTNDLDVRVREQSSEVGGGALPTIQLPGFVVALQHRLIGAEHLARRLRTGKIRVFGRIHQDEVLLDLRSVMPEDDSRLALAVRLIESR